MCTFLLPIEQNLVKVLTLIEEKNSRTFLRKFSDFLRKFKDLKITFKTTMCLSVTYISHLSALWRKQRQFLKIQGPYPFYKDQISSQKFQGPWESWKPFLS